MPSLNYVGPKGLTGKHVVVTNQINGLYQATPTKASVRTDVESVLSSLYDSASFNNRIANLTKKAELDAVFQGKIQTSDVGTLYAQLDESRRLPEGIFDYNRAPSTNVDALKGSLITHKLTSVVSSPLIGDEQRPVTVAGTQEAAYVYLPVPFRVKSVRLLAYGQIPAKVTAGISITRAKIVAEVVTSMSASAASLGTVGEGYGRAGGTGATENIEVTPVLADVNFDSSNQLYVRFTVSVESGVGDVYYSDFLGNVSVLAIRSY